MFFLSNFLQICSEIYFYFADQKVVTENPIRTTRFASITTPLPVRKNDKFSDSGEGLVYDLGNYVFVRNFINLCLIHLLVQKTIGYIQSIFNTFNIFECGQILTLFNIFYTYSTFLTVVKSNISCKFEYLNMIEKHLTTFKKY